MRVSMCVCVREAQSHTHARTSTCRHKCMHTYTPAHSYLHHALTPSTHSSFPVRSLLLPFLPFLCGCWHTIHTGLCILVHAPAKPKQEQRHRALEASLLITQESLLQDLADNEEDFAPEGGDGRGASRA